MVIRTQLHQVRSRTHVTETDDPLKVMDGNPEFFLMANLDDDILSIAVKEGFGSRDVQGVEQFFHDLKTP
jgi:hypothetical protein